MLAAYDIAWDVDIDSAVADTLSASADTLSDLFGEDILEIFAEMPQDDKIYFITERFEQNPSLMYSLYGIPTRIEIPEDVAKYDDIAVFGIDDVNDKISDYISDQTGYCHTGFKVMDDSLGERLPDSDDDPEQEAPCM